MNLRRRFNQICSECSLQDLKRKGIKYDFQPTENIYDGRIYKIITGKECGKE